MNRMRFLMCALVAASGLALAGCAAPATSQRVSVSGDAYIISQLTAGTWTAIAEGNAPSAGSRNTQSTLVTMIEKTSGCKVTSSDYSSQGRQLDAQVDCGGRRE